MSRKGSDEARPARPDRRTSPEHDVTPQSRIDRRELLRAVAATASGAIVARSVRGASLAAAPAPPSVLSPAAEALPNAPLVVDALSSLGRQGDPPGPLSAGALDDAAGSGVTMIDWTVAAGTDFEEAVAGVAEALAE